MQTVLEFFRQKVDSCIENKQELIRRKTMLEEYYRNTYNSGHYIRRPRQFDSTRRQLTVCGYLSDSRSSGFYKILKPIEPGLTSSALRKKYNSVKIKQSSAYKESVPVLVKLFGYFKKK